MAFFGGFIGAALLMRGNREAHKRLMLLAHVSIVVAAVVLLSAEEYQHLRSLDRRAMHVSELPDEELAALDAVEAPAEATRYNHEMT